MKYKKKSGGVKFCTSTMTREVSCRVTISG